MDLQLKKAAFVAFIGFIIYMVLQLISLFNFVGNEYDILVQWISVISLVLMGVFVGILVSEKKIPAKTALVNLLLVLVGLTLIPIVAWISATFLNTTDLAMEAKTIVTFIFSASCGIVYMAVFILYRKRQYSTDWETQ